MAESENKSDGNDQTVYDSLNGIQKSAILMMLLGEEEASEIIKNLGPKEVQALGAAMYSVQGLGQDTVNQVLDEFLFIIKQQTSLGLELAIILKMFLIKQSEKSALNLF